MNTDTKMERDNFEAFSRRSLFAALFVVLATGVAAVMALLTPGSELGANAMRILGLVITVAVVATLSIKQRVRSDDPNLHAVVNDELRQQSLHRGYRNAFFATLLAQPVLALVAPPAIMAVVTIALALSTVLVSVLWFDR